MWRGAWPGAVLCFVEGWGDELACAEVQDEAPQLPAHHKILTSDKTATAPLTKNVSAAQRESARSRFRTPIT